MSSSEQAPEPTMDEILASIRKIIADDDDSAGPAPDASAELAPEGGAHGQPRLADDIASALNHNTAPGENEDDIFDLTNAVPEPPQAPPAPASSDAFAPPPAEMPPGAMPAPESAASPVAPMPPAPSAGEPAAAHPRDILAGAPMEESALPESAAGFGAAEPPPADASWPETESGPVGDTTRPAGPEPASGHGEITDLDSYAPGRNIGGNNDLVDAAYARSEVVAGKTAPDPPMEPGPDMAAFMPEMPSAGDALDSPELPGEAVAAGLDTAAAAELSESVMVPPPPAAFESAESAETEDKDEAAASASAKTLEDSVKDMLRPMLREWLDDNMQRIVEDAVKDELHNKHNQF